MCVYVLCVYLCVGVLWTVQHVGQSAAAPRVRARTRGCGAEVIAEDLRRVPGWQELERPPSGSAQAVKLTFAAKWNLITKVHPHRQSTLTPPSRLHTLCPQLLAPRCSLLPPPSRQERCCARRRRLVEWRAVLAGTVNVGSGCWQCWLAVDVGSLDHGACDGSLDHCACVCVLAVDVGLDHCAHSL